MFAKDIYISTGSMQAGGTERVISILSNQLVSKGFRIKIFIWRSVPVFYKIDSSIEIIDIPQRCGSASLIKGMLYFRRYLKSFPPHFLLGFSAPFNIISLISSDFAQFFSALACFLSSTNAFIFSGNSSLSSCLNSNK